MYRIEWMGHNNPIAIFFTGFCKNIWHNRGTYGTDCFHIQTDFFQNMINIVLDIRILQGALKYDFCVLHVLVISRYDEISLADF